MDNNGYRLLLPEGTLDYFIISDVKESASEIVIYLEEKNEVPKEYAGMKVESKGFYEPVVVQDFPIRGKKLFLNVRRRRGVVKDENRYVSRDWKLVAGGLQAGGNAVRDRRGTARAAIPESPERLSLLGAASSCRRMASFREEHRCLCGTG